MYTANLKVKEFPPSVRPAAKLSDGELRIGGEHLLQTVFFALWLLAAPKERIGAAWQAKAVRFNLLLKDFSDAPRWFADLAGQLNRMQFPALYVRA